MNWLLTGYPQADIAFSGFAGLCAGFFIATVWVARRMSTTSAYKRLRELEIALSDLRELHELLLASHKRLRSRVGMREKRARDAATATRENETPEEWKTRMRRELHIKRMGGD